MSILLHILAPDRPDLAEGDHHSVLVYPPDHGPTPGEDPNVLTVFGALDDWNGPLTDETSLVSMAGGDAPVHLPLTEMPQVARALDDPGEDAPGQDVPDADGPIDPEPESPGGDPMSPSPNRYAAVAYTLHAPPVYTRVAFGDRNAFYDHFAVLLHVHPDRLLYLHSIPHPPEDLVAAHTTPMLAQLACEQDEGSPMRYVLLDTEFRGHQARQAHDSCLYKSLASRSCRWQESLHTVLEQFEWTLAA